MIGQEDLGLVMGQMLEGASREFRATEEYRLLQEKRVKMSQECEGMFQESERQFVEECFQLLEEISASEKRHAYQQGMRDCVAVLKKLGVLC